MAVTEDRAARHLRQRARSGEHKHSPPRARCANGEPNADRRRTCEEGARDYEGRQRERELEGEPDDERRLEPHFNREAAIVEKALGVLLKREPERWNDREGVLDPRHPNARPGSSNDDGESDESVGERARDQDVSEGQVRMPGRFEMRHTRSGVGDGHPVCKNVSGEPRGREKRNENENGSLHFQAQAPLPDRRDARFKIKKIAVIVDPDEKRPARELRKVASLYDDRRQFLVDARRVVAVSKRWLVLGCGAFPFGEQVSHSLFDPPDSWCCHDLFKREAA
jgi:hypothetical protein